MDPFRTGKIVLFQVTYDRDWHPFELIGELHVPLFTSIAGSASERYLAERAGFLLLGLFGGIYGALFAKGNIWWGEWSFTSE